MITHELNFGTFTIYPHVMVGELAEGTNLDIDKLKTIKALAEEHYEDSFGYIGNRINSFSIDPCTYRALKPMSNLISLAYVTYRQAQLHALELERDFLPSIPVGTFYRLDDAFRWTEQMLQAARAYK
ncbi:MAG: hypothetical protein AAGF10_02975 [Verrucomicrobiota bacterium]